MNYWLFLIAATLLSLERICYIWAWRSPESFRAFCNHPEVAFMGEPVSVLQKLFYGFKGIQFAVFLGWCYFHGREAPPLLTESGFFFVAGDLGNLNRRRTNSQLQRVSPLRQDWSLLRQQIWL